MADFDAIVVGGGIAGATFALELRRAGARVAVIERTARPTLKVCGDFLSGEAQELLAYLGLDIRAMGAHAIRTLRLATGARRAEVTLPFTAAGLSRLALDEALLQKAQAAGAEVIRGEGATALEPAGSTVRVRIGSKVLTADCAGLATGKHNLRGWPRTPGTMTAYKIQLEPSLQAARSLQDVVQLVSYRGGYVGACLVEEGQATICWILDAEAMRAVGPEWTTQLDHIACSSPVFGDLLGGARYLSTRPAAISGFRYGYRRREPIAPNVYPVGDQLCVIYSFTGDGTALAMSSGIAAANARLTGVSAGDFQTAFHERVRAQFQWAQAVDTTFKSALMRHFSVGAIAALPPLARLIASMTRVQGVDELTALAPATAQAR